ncbi:MAG TPA: hypothetical protein VGX49_11795 [Jatrophihabitans sp.]|jgi:hypothetical protein|nr:hypothetical protein [Jatrophihabitans sp.]
MPTEVTLEIQRRLVDGDAAERVDALDVLTHALEFAGSDDSLSTWRQALHERTVTAQAIAAVDELVHYITNEYAKGNHYAASEICDCLDYIAQATDRLPDRTW